MPHYIVPGGIPKFEPSGVAGPNPQPPRLGPGLYYSYDTGTIGTRMIGPSARMLPPLLYSVGSLKARKINPCFHRELYGTSRNSFPVLMPRIYIQSYRHIEPEHLSPNFVSVRFAQTTCHPSFLSLCSDYIPVTCAR